MPAMFEFMQSSPHDFSDQARFQQLAAHGTRALKKGDFDELRQVVGGLGDIWIGTDTSSDNDAIPDMANIIRG